MLPDKVEMVRDKMSRLLMDRWGVPLLGVVPDMAYLGRPTLANLCSALQGELLAGERCARLHYGVDDAFLITTGLRRFLRRAFEQREKVWRRPRIHTQPPNPSRTRGPTLLKPRRLRRDLSLAAPLPPWRQSL